MGATQERILAALGRTEVEAITLEDIERMIGNWTAIKDGQLSVDEAFPEIAKPAADVTPADQGRRMKLGEKKSVVTVDDSAVKEDASK
jgi:hypothetical protein